MGSPATAKQQNCSEETASEEGNFTEIQTCMDRFGGNQPALKMASKCPPRPLAAPHLRAWAHAQRGRDGQHLPLSRDAAGARGAGISMGGAVYCRAWLVGAWLETRLARPRVAPPPC